MAVPVEPGAGESNFTHRGFVEVLRLGVAQLIEADLAGANQDISNAEDECFDVSGLGGEGVRLLVTQ